MITKKQAYHLLSRGIEIKFLLPISLVLVGFLVSFCLIQKNWGVLVGSFCGLYVLSLTFFFIAQVIGFVRAQTDYSEQVEAPKFRLLELEEAEWKR